jgi:hypothetical protein
MAEAEGLRPDCEEGPPGLNGDTQGHGQSPTAQGIRGDARLVLVWNNPWGPAEAAQGGARASGPRDCGGGGGAVGKFPGRPRGAPSPSCCSSSSASSRNGALGASGRLATPLSACAGTETTEWSRPSPRRKGGGQRPRGSGRAPPSPSSPLPPLPLIWRAREALLGVPAPARERPAPPAQLTRGSRNAEPSPAGSRGARSPAPQLAAPRTPPRPRPALGPRQTVRPRGTRAD